jgi:HPt (histidine-containing phosphotransfer) domain-containing protein
MTLATSLRAYVQPRGTRLGEMRHEFLQRTDSDLATLTAHWSAREDRGATPSSLAAMRSIAHGLAGSGGIFGFDDISDAAAALEEALIIANGSPGSINQIESALKRLAACAEAKGGSSRTADRIYE